MNANMQRSATLPLLALLNDWRYGDGEADCWGGGVERLYHISKADALHIAPKHRHRSERKLSEDYKLGCYRLFS